MRAPYFSPHILDEQRACRTCRHSVGAPDGWHLWCERHRLVVVFPCAWWEREAGADDELLNGSQRPTTYGTAGNRRA